MKCLNREGKQKLQTITLFLLLITDNQWALLVLKRKKEGA